MGLVDKLTSQIVSLICSLASEDIKQKEEEKKGGGGGTGD